MFDILVPHPGLNRTRIVSGIHQGITQAWRSRVDRECGTLISRAGVGDGSERASTIAQKASVRPFTRVNSKTKFMLAIVGDT
jgi:hypothetical protein